MMKRLDSIFILTMLAALFLISFNNKQQSRPSISPYAENDRYWHYKGEPLLLLEGPKANYLFN